MYFRRFYDEALAQASYLLGSPESGEAIVVDPNRDITSYLDAAGREGLRVTHVTETHIHADFVSGARELAQRAGARLLLSDEGGPDWRYRYAAADGATLLRDGDTVRVGLVELGVIHTPGHTPEHLAFLVTDTAAATEPMGAVTGDFVFVGDVGRPDLLERAAHIAGTMEAGARQLFRSLQRLTPLPDYLQIWPGHGAGSACGKALGAVPQSTLGYERRFNWAFGIREEEAFVRAVLAGQPDPPRYFAEMKRINRDGPRILGEATHPRRLSVEALAEVLANGGVVVDARPADEYARRAIPGTLNIPANRAFTTWAGWLLPYDRDFHVIAPGDDGGRVDELIGGLSGIGLDRVAGYFGAQVVDAWPASRGPLQTIPTIGTSELAASLGGERVAVLDVRNDAEWAAGHLPDAVHIPLGHLDECLDRVPRDRPVVVHCQAGGRAAMAAALLRARGVADVRIYSGGYSEWIAAGQPTAAGAA
jgi:hydroxyacylglutathione hydrolase